MKSRAQFSQHLMLTVMSCVITLLVLLFMQAVLIKSAPITNPPVPRAPEPAAVAAQPTPVPPVTIDRVSGDGANGNAGIAVVDHSNAAGDPQKGEKLFKTFNPKAGVTCLSCHLATSDDRLVGPGLRTVGARAGKRVAGMAAEAYIRQSILQPGAYVVDGYPDIMPKTFSASFTAGEVDDLVQYLLTLQN